MYYTNWKYWQFKNKNGISYISTSCISIWSNKSTIPVICSFDTPFFKLKSVNSNMSMSIFMYLYKTHAFSLGVSNQQLCCCLKKSWNLCSSCLLICFSRPLDKQKERPHCRLSSFNTTPKELLYDDDISSSASQTHYLIHHLPPLYELLWWRVASFP